MAAAEFSNQLRTLGYGVEDLGGGRIAFPYEIPLGRFAGKTIRIGFNVPQDFPLTPPSGILVTPHLLPLQGGGQHPSGGIHDGARFGFDSSWQYWSRPMDHWHQTLRTAKEVMAHVRHLFDTQ